MPAEIRPATLADETAVLDLIEELFQPPSARPPRYTRALGALGIAWAVEQPRTDILLAVDGGELVGLASVYVDIESIRFGRRCWLQDLVTRSDRRSEGIGAALIAASRDWARKHGCTHLELSSGAARTDAHRFYEREGMGRSYNFTLWVD
ncbi:MAG: GNAT family N-acetyltransferase [Dehalococcoidia bacterium]